MANSVDFRSNQIQTSKIIVTGSSPEKTLLIYGIAADGTPANQGNIGPTFDTSVIGSDVFLFVSGVIGGKDGTDPGITVIGGDLHISGNLTVDGSSPGGGGGTNFFTEINATSIYTTSSVAMPYLSSSTGAQITGSFILSSSTPAVILTSVRQGEPSVTAPGLYAYSHGRETAAQGDYSHAEGRSCVASGPQSHAEGNGTVASGNQSHAEGYQTLASGAASHAEGFQTVTYGLYSHAEGTGSVTYGDYAHASGIKTIAFGTGSYAGGLWTIASGAVDGAPIATSQTAVGKYNKRNNTTSLFVVGDGIGDSDALRHDVLRVESGSVQVTGSLFVNGTQITGTRLYASDGVASFGTGNASITGLGDASTFTLSGSASSVFAYNTLGDTTAPKIIWSLPVGARKITMYTRVTATNGWTTSASNRYFQTVLKYAGDGGAPTTVLFGFGINGGNNAYTGDKRTGSNQGSGPYSSGPGFFELTTTDTWLRVIWDLEQQVMTYAFGVGTHTTKPKLWKTGGTGYIYATSAGGPWPVSDDAQIVASIESFDSPTPGFTLTMQPEIIVE